MSKKWPKTYPVNKKTGKPKHKKDVIPANKKVDFIPFATGQHESFCPGNYAEIPYTLCGCKAREIEDNAPELFGVKYPFLDGKGYTRNGSPTFYNLLEEMAETHDKKSHDYASNSDPYGNYEFAGMLACMFSHSPGDAGFAGRLAEKIYRLSNLESGNKTPKNESIEDTERDIAVITALWMSSRRDRRKILPEPKK